MIRLLVAIAAGVFFLMAVACTGDSSDEGKVAVSEPTRTPKPTLTPIPTPTPLDPNTGCGPPLLEDYCVRVYRPPPPSCPVSLVWKFRSGIAPGIGRPPVWMVAESVAGPFKPRPTLGPPVKTIWVVADEQAGEVKLTGRRLDGSSVAIFPLYDRDPNFYQQYGAGTYQMRWDRTELVLVPPHGIDHDHRTEVAYPSAGCWQFTARTETATVEIVQYLYEE